MKSMKYSDGKNYKVIALCMASFSYSEQIEFIGNFDRVCKKHDFRLMIFSSITDFYTEALSDKGEEQIFSLMEPEKFDAVVIMSESIKRENIAENIAERVIKAGVPCFSVVRPIEGCINITFDFESAFEQVVRHMVEYHKPHAINFMAGKRGNIFSEKRLNVFKKVLEENNIPFEEDRIGYGDFWEDPTALEMERFLKSGKEFDCVIAANDFMAMEVCRVLQVAGKRVPEDVLVSGFDGVELEKYHYPRLCTAETDKVAMAEKLGELIEDVVNGKSVSEDNFVISEYRPGESCGCIKIESGNKEFRELGRKYFLVNKHEREITSHMEAMYEKIPPMGNADNLKKCWADISYFANAYISGDFLLALNTDFLNDNMEIWPNLRPMSLYDPHHYYTEEMLIPLKLLNGRFSSGDTVKSSDLVPNLENYLETGRYIIFLPCHVQNSTIGYMAAGFYPENYEYFMLYSYAMHLRQVIEMQKYRIDQQNLYSTDQLTKLFNRKGFYRQMEGDVQRAIRNKTELGVISIDMNWLKQINDTHGHKEGDFALAKISEFMKKAAGNLGVCTRFGGDEFAIALVGDNASEKIEEIKRTILEDIDKFNNSKKKPYPISVSMGSVVKIPTINYDIERYIVEADRLMYADKAKFKETHIWKGKEA